MINREHYISKIRPFYESDLIKVITGIRRCGKSVILSQMAMELKSQGKEILMINFEQLEYSTKITNTESLSEYVESKIPEGKKLYVFLDEVQILTDGTLPVVHFD